MARVNDNSMSRAPIAAKAVRTRLAAAKPLLYKPPSFVGV
jgi:hypothetical protein